MSFPHYIRASDYCSWFGAVRMTSRFPVSNLLTTVGPADTTRVSESHHKVGNRLVGQTPAARRHGREPTIRQATPIGRQNRILVA